MLFELITSRQSIEVLMWQICVVQTLLSVIWCAEYLSSAEILVLEYGGLRDKWVEAPALPVALSGPRAASLEYTEDGDKPWRRKQRVFLTGQTEHYGHFLFFQSRKFPLIDSKYFIFSIHYTSWLNWLKRFSDLKDFNISNKL